MTLADCWKAILGKMMLANGVAGIAVDGHFRWTVPPGQEGPGYWMYETSGVLRPAMEAYLQHKELLSDEQIATLRAYFRQWIDSSVWDNNPHIDADSCAWLAMMRLRVDKLTTREAIDSWLADASDAGMDPL
jgi:hypothetical protein